ncbi:MAG TPA: hypothetical protein VGS60_19225 [Actinomycetes bacterium]|nr:hypothetical protein [Actinomycetes bacterium]
MAGRGVGGEWAATAIAVVRVAPVREGVGAFDVGELATGAQASVTT